MLSLAPTVKIYVSPEAVDMRKFFDGLEAVVCDVVKQDPQSGHLLLFVSERRDRANII